MEKRHFLASVVVLVAASLAFAQETAGVRQVKIGSLEVTALQDGEVKLPPSLLQGTRPGEIESTYGSAAPVSTSVNAFLVRDGKHLVLVDTGGGPAYGGNMGHLAERLKQAGIDPAAIEAVLITHLHPDHFGGLVTADGKRAFPRAQLRLSRAEYDYWTNPALETQMPAERKPMLNAVKAALAPYQAEGACRPFAPQEAPFPGVAAITTSGHTPGHTVYVFGSGKNSFWAIGDSVHFGAVQFKHPEAGVMFDSDSSKAVAARLELWNKAAKEGAVVGGAHLAFPGLGHVVAQKQGFEWQPLP
jgi:glyoxylase-like metal-dependent hydrolase (beta-lactamase superfamily II)